MIVHIELMGKTSRIPVQAHSTDFGYDCYATSVEELAPNIYKYGLGIKIAIADDTLVVDPAKTSNLISDVDEMFKTPQGKFGFTLRPRSSIWKTGMVLANSPGTVDEHYRGEICAIFYHIFPNMPKYEVGDRICQLHLDFSPDFDFIKVDKIDTNTDRGESGFGSTGITDIDYTMPEIKMVETEVNPNDVTINVFPYDLHYDYTQSDIPSGDYEYHLDYNSSVTDTTTPYSPEK